MGSIRDFVNVESLSKKDLSRIYQNAVRFWTGEDDSNYRIIAAYMFSRSDTVYCGAVFPVKSALLRMGGAFSDIDLAHSSMQKGESDLDNLRIIQLYGDLVIIRDVSRQIRHYVQMADIPYNEYVRKPLINAGDSLDANPLTSLFKGFQSYTRHRKKLIKGGRFGELDYQIIVSMGLLKWATEESI